MPAKSSPPPAAAILSLGRRIRYDISRGEKSLSGLDFPKIASLYVIYDLPFYKGQHGFVGKVLGGYQANATWRYSSGQSRLTHKPFTNSSCQNTFDTTFFGRFHLPPLRGKSRGTD